LKTFEDKKSFSIERLKKSTTYGIFYFIPNPIYSYKISKKINLSILLMMVSITDFQQALPVIKQKQEAEEQEPWFFERSRTRISGRAGAKL